MIVSHGSLEAMVRAEAERFGWRSRIVDVDVDTAATAAAHYTVRAPGRGTIIIERDGRHTAIDYWLPEEEEELRRTLHAALRGDEYEGRRLRDRHVGDPLVVGG